MERFFGTLRNHGIFKTVECSEPEEYLESCQASMMQHFFKEPCVILAYLETWYMQNLRNNQNLVKHLYDVVFS